ncbi:hypothetical protein AAVH_27584, partial [Aphelenchoides avenae]
VIPLRLASGVLLDIFTYLDFSTLVFLRFTCATIEELITSNACNLAHRRNFRLTFVPQLDSEFVGDILVLEDDEHELPVVATVTTSSGEPLIHVPHVDQLNSSYYNVPIIPDITDRAVARDLLENAKRKVPRKILSGLQNLRCAVGMHRISSVDFGPWWAWTPLKAVVTALPAVKYAKSLSLQYYSSDLISSKPNEFYRFLEQFRNARSLRLMPLSSDQCPWSCFTRKCFLRLENLHIVDNGRRLEDELYLFGSRLYSWCSDFRYFAGDQVKYLRLQTTLTTREVVGRIIRAVGTSRGLVTVEFKCWEEALDNVYTMGIDLIQLEYDSIEGGVELFRYAYAEVPEFMEESQRSSVKKHGDVVVLSRSDEDRKIFVIVTNNRSHFKRYPAASW